MQLSLLILAAEFRSDCAIDRLLSLNHVMVVRSAPAPDLRDLAVVQTLLPAPDIFGMPIGMTNCTWDADDTMIMMRVLLAGWLDRIRF